MGEELLDADRHLRSAGHADAQREASPSSRSHTSRATGSSTWRAWIARPASSIDHLPDPPAIFSLIQERGQISPEEMYRVFNMGIGFCVVVSPAGAERVKEIAEAHSFRA